MLTVYESKRERLTYGTLAALVLTGFVTSTAPTLVGCVDSEECHFPGDICILCRSSFTLDSSSYTSSDTRGFVIKYIYYLRSW